MGFNKGFQKIAAQNKEAFIAPLIGGIARAAGSVAGKAGGAVLSGANKVLGGPLGTFMTGVDAVRQFKNNNQKMMSAVQR